MKNYNIKLYYSSYEDTEGQHFRTVANKEESEKIVSSLNKVLERFVSNIYLYDLFTDDGFNSLRLPKKIKEDILSYISSYEDIEDIKKIYNSDGSHYNVIEFLFDYIAGFGLDALTKDGKYVYLGFRENYGGKLTFVDFSVKNYTDVAMLKYNQDFFINLINIFEYDRDIFFEDIFNSNLKLTEELWNKIECTKMYKHKKFFDNIAFKVIDYNQSLISEITDFLTEEEILDLFVFKYAYEMECVGCNYEEIEVDISPIKTILNDGSLSDSEKILKLKKIVD